MHLSKLPLLKDTFEINAVQLFKQLYFCTYLYWCDSGRTDTFILILVILMLFKQKLV